jgi:hypothetical protein
MEMVRRQLKILPGELSEAGLSQTRQNIRSLEKGLALKAERLSRMISNVHKRETWRPKSRKACRNVAKFIDTFGISSCDESLLQISLTKTTTASWKRFEVAICWPKKKPRLKKIPEDLSVCLAASKEKRIERSNFPRWVQHSSIVERADGGDRKLLSPWAPVKPQKRHDLKLAEFRAHKRSNLPPGQAVNWDNGKLSER